MMWTSNHHLEGWIDEWIREFTISILFKAMDLKGWHLKDLEYLHLI
jgi:hypothetical protein